jgi:class 3 adenylate cyclase
LGAIIHKDVTIYGNSVNVAAGLESFADPRGMIISQAVYEGVEGKLEGNDLSVDSIANL